MSRLFTEDDRARLTAAATVLVEDLITAEDEDERLDALADFVHAVLPLRMLLRMGLRALRGYFTPEKIAARKARRAERRARREGAEE